MDDELDNTLAKAFIEGNWYVETGDHKPVHLKDVVAAIAAAIRSRFCVSRHRYVAEYEHEYENCVLGEENDTCFDCGQPKPGPATGESSFTAVVKGKKVEAGDVVKLNDDGTVSKITPADERGEDAEAIKMWREHDKHS